MKKKILTIALTLIFCCMGLFAFSGCEKQSDYYIAVSFYPISCGKFIAKGDKYKAPDGKEYSGGSYEMPYEYIDAMCAKMTVECYIKGNENPIWETKGLTGENGLREKGGSVSINVGSIGTHIARCTVVMEDGTSASVEWSFKVEGYSDNSFECGNLQLTSQKLPFSPTSYGTCRNATYTFQHDFSDLDGDGKCDVIKGTIKPGMLGEKCGGAKKSAVEY